MGSKLTTESVENAHDAASHAKARKRRHKRSNATCRSSKLVTRHSEENTMCTETSTSTTILHHAPAPSPPKPPIMTERERRLLDAENVLGEIAKEFAAKRAAGLVPTVPVPARTLLWEEMARNERTVRAGKRGQCIYGRDTGTICGCTNYTKTAISRNREVCACCQHGAPWHRLTGGNTWLSRSTSRFGTNSMASIRSIQSLRSGMKIQQVNGRPSRDSIGYRSSELEDEEFDEEDEDEEDDDDDAIALEVARPYGYDHDPDPPLAPSRLDRNSMLSSIGSVNSSLGLSRRLSSTTTNRLERLLKAIQAYRAMGLSEDEIEARIRQDFPPVPSTTV